MKTTFFQNNSRKKVVFKGEPRNWVVRPSSTKKYDYDQLYLNNESALAFEKAKTLYNLEAPDKLKVENLKLLVKAAIDNQDKEQADLYFNKLLKKNTIPDFLFAAVYYRFKGDFQKGNTYIRKSNPQLLHSNKLKEIYSQNTINTYIIAN